MKNLFLFILFVSLLSCSKDSTEPLSPELSQILARVENMTFEQSISNGFYLKFDGKEISCNAMDASEHIFKYEKLESVQVPENDNNKGNRAVFSGEGYTATVTIKDVPAGALLFDVRKGTTILQQWIYK